MNISIVFLGIVVFVSFSIQAMTGFGSIIIAITLGSIFFPIKTVLPVLVLLDFFLNIYMVLKYKKMINYEILLKKILPFMSIGVVIGMLIFYFIASGSKVLLGSFIVFLSVFELYNQYKKNERKPVNIISNLFFVLAGIVQGIYASGGPFVVYIIGKQGVTKSVFRSTLAALWVIMDMVLIISYLLTNTLNKTTVTYSLFLAPVVITGIVVGEMLHHKVNEQLFKLIIYSLLLFAGISILLFG